MAPSFPRVFIAACLNKKSLLSLEPLIRWLRNEVQNVRWVPEQQLHTTLLFLGDLEPEPFETLKHGLDSVEPPALPLEVGIRGVGGLGRRSSLGVVHLELGPGSPALVSWNKEVSEAAREAGLNFPTRAFIPHLTLGRPKGKLKPVSVPRELSPYRPLLFDKVRVFSSELGRKGAVHTALVSLS